MPKPKPDKVVRHEIVLGRAEREMLDTAIAGMTFNRVATPAVALLSDVSALTAIILVLEASGIIALDKGIFGDLLNKLESGSYATAQELLDAFNAAVDAAEGAAEFAEDPFKAKQRVARAKSLTNRLALALVYAGQKLNPLN